MKRTFLRLIIQPRRSPEIAFSFLTITDGSSITDIMYIHPRERISIIKESWHMLASCDTEISSPLYHNLKEIFSYFLTVNLTYSNKGHYDPRI